MAPLGSPFVTARIPKNPEPKDSQDPAARAALIWLTAAYAAERQRKGLVVRVEVK